MVVYDLFDCAISSPRLEELVKKKEKEKEQEDGGGGKGRWKGGILMERGEEDLELWEAREALERADLVCICFSVVKEGRERAWELAPLVRRFIPDAAILFVGTEREKRQKILASSEVGSILLGGGGRGGGRGREGILMEREGWEMMRRMEEGERRDKYGYVEVSVKSLEGVKGFVRSGLRMVKKEETPAEFR